jgi:hypothetical protein
VDSVSELPDLDLEKARFLPKSKRFVLLHFSQAVDKIGRTARRTADTHIKNALSKPRVATTLRRMTAMFNFVPDLREETFTILLQLTLINCPAS